MIGVTIYSDLLSEFHFLRFQIPIKLSCI
jgi:hypothetical protein